MGVRQFHKPAQLLNSGIGNVDVNAVAFDERGGLFHVLISPLQVLQSIFFEDGEPFAASPTWSYRCSKRRFTFSSPRAGLVRTGRLWAVPRTARAIEACAKTTTSTFCDNSSRA